MATFHGEPYPGFFKPLTDAGAKASNSSIASWEVNWMAPLPPKINDTYYDFILDKTLQYDGSNWIACKDTSWIRDSGASDESKITIACDYGSEISIISTTDLSYVDGNTTIGLTSSQPIYSSFVVFNNNDNKPLVTINLDGTVELGEAVASVEDAASVVFWRALEQCGRIHPEQVAMRVLEDLRLVLGVPPGEDIVLHALRLMNELADKSVIAPDPVQVVDPIEAYERAMKVV